MPKIVTQEEFISRCRALHGDRYDYSRTVYVAAKKPITVGCPVHGWFQTHAGNHSTMTGCPACGRERSEAAKRNDQQSFLAASRERHGDTYDYSHAVYVEGKRQVEIGCPIHGFFKQKASDHMLGKGCSKCGKARFVAASKARVMPSEEFFAKCREKHAGRYEYPEQTFLGTVSEIRIVCPKHGIFSAHAGNHLRMGTGCQKCGYEAASDAKKVPLQEWLERAGEMHGNKYGYDTAGWDGSHTLVRIKCAKHGWWVQKAIKHTQGQGCPKCACERLKGRWQPETLTEEYANGPCFLYYLRMWSSDETFYKVGISSNVGVRCTKLRWSGYKVAQIEKIPGTRKSCLEMEIALFKEFDEIAAYVPKLAFPGDGECFAFDILLLDTNS